MSEDKSAKTDFFSYKGYPLVRCGNTIYYGNMYDKFVVVIQIQETKKVDDINIATKMKVFKMLTDDKLPANKQIVKAIDKTELFDALDTASYWLSKAS